MLDLIMTITLLKRDLLRPLSNHSLPSDMSLKYTLEPQFELLCAINLTPYYYSNESYFKSCIKITY